MCSPERLKIAYLLKRLNLINGTSLFSFDTDHLFMKCRSTFSFSFLFLSAVERGGASGREGIQDGCSRRLPARRVRPDEAVLDPGLGVTALLPHAEGEAAAYQSQGALLVKRRWRGGGRREARLSTAVKRRRKRTPAPSSCSPVGLCPLQQPSQPPPVLPHQDCFLFV